MNISTRQLRGFVLLARLGSFTRAAEQLNITQAGLSAMVRDLETQFGCRLFDRTTRSVSLTNEGQGLLPYAERILNEVEAAVSNVKASTAQAQHILTVAATQVVASGFMLQACRAFSAIEPTVKVRIRDVAQPQIQNLVERGEVDAGFSIFLKPAAGIETRPLLHFRLMCVSPAGTFRTRRRKQQDYPELAWSKLPAGPLIGLPADTLLQREIDAYLDTVGRANEVRPICNSMQTIISMVEAGYGSAVLPAMIIPLCPPERFDLAYMASPPAPLPFYLISKKGRHLPQPMDPFVQTFVEVVSRLCTP